MHEWKLLQTECFGFVEECVLKLQWMLHDDEELHTSENNVRALNGWWQGEQLPFIQRALWPVLKPNNFGRLVRRN